MYSWRLGYITGYTLNENIDMLSGKDDPTVKKRESAKEVKAEEEQA